MTELSRKLPQPEIDPAHLDTLHARLVTAAEADRLIDISYRIIESPVGDLLVAATEHGLLRVAYQCEDHERILQLLSDQVSPRVLEAPRRLDAVARQLDEYLSGARQAFEVPLDLRLAHGFRLSVLSQLQLIGYGLTQSYADIARAAGNPRAVRAVGTACARNPLPIVVPCHRVVRSDGSLGNYVGGPEVKHTLLALEAA